MPSPSTEQWYLPDWWFQIDLSETCVEVKEGDQMGFTYFAVKSKTSPVGYKFTRHPQVMAFKALPVGATLPVQGESLRVDLLHYPGEFSLAAFYTQGVGC